MKERDWMGTVLLIYGLIASVHIMYQFEAKKKEATKNMVIFLSLYLISFSVCKAIDRIETTVQRVDLNAMVIFENDTIKTEPNYIYIGRTNRYVFFFDRKNERADVIPQDKIKKISFRYQKP